LKKHLQNPKGNARYTSHVIQNQLITICGDLIRAELLKSIRTARFFSVIADEATDTANVEQLSLSIRFVENNAPCEKFMGFLKCEAGTTGEAIANMILTQLEEWQLEPQLLQGQAYDGAGAMAGLTKGSPKRQLALEKWINDVLQGEKRHKLKEMCRTRWIERHEAFEIFLDLFLPTVSCLEEVTSSRGEEWNRETCNDAHSYLLAISQFTFIVALVLTQKVLAFTKGTQL